MRMMQYLMLNFGGDLKYNGDGFTTFTLLPENLRQVATTCDIE